MEHKPSSTFRSSRYLIITRDLVMPLFIILGCLLAWWGALISPLFAIHTIDCQVDYHSCDNENLLMALQTYRGRNLLSLDTRSLSVQLTSADFTIREAVVTKILPGTLQLALQSVYPTVAARAGDPPVWVVFDPQLRVIGTRTVDPNVPTITVPSISGLQVGFIPQDELLLASLHLAQIVGVELPTLKSLHVDGSMASLVLPDNLTAIMDVGRDALPQIRALQAILANATILAGVHVIDVRFTQPVLR